MSYLQSFFLFPFLPTLLWTVAGAAVAAGIGYVATHLKYAVGLPGYSFWQTLHLASPKMKFYDLHLKNAVWYARHALAIDEIKSVPYAPVSHPYVERLIGTIRREYLDRTFFWNAVDLARKLDVFQIYYNAVRVHRSLDGVTPAQCAGGPSPAPAALDHYAWSQHCRGMFQTPLAA